MTKTIDFERLNGLGLTPAMAAHLAAHAAPDDESLQLMRLTEVHRETCRLHDGHAERSARVLPRLQHELAAQDLALAVGDWLLAAPDAEGGLWAQARVPPLTRIVRRDADGSRHAVVSNVDTALLVMGLDDDFNPRRLERYLALVSGSGVQAVVVLTKADALSFRDAAERVSLLHRRIHGLEAVLAVDARHASAAEALAPWLGAGRTVVLLGSSGAGKSTLTNSLIGAAVQDTGAVREHDSRGKHTTTSRSLHRLAGGACVIDTPGLRALRPDVDADTLGTLFGDVAAASRHCRFRDCRHAGEPGCAVQAALDEDRIDNYQKLLREARRDTLTALDRQRQRSLWKARGREAEMRAKAKRGEE